MSIGATVRGWFSPHDMSHGAPWKRILEFALPMLVGNMAQQLYNTADSIIVGRYVGDNALAAVGSASPILNLMLAMFVGVATGAGILVAQSFGAKDRERLSRTIGSCITLIFIVCVITAVLGSLVTRPMLELLGTPDSIIDWCTQYLTIFFVGGAGFAFYNILSGILRGLGDSLSALGFLLIATVLNVVLDLFFVAKLGLGVPGVALATIMAQTVSAVLCFIKLRSMRGVFSMGWNYLNPRGGYIGNIIRVGVPSGLTQAIFSMAMIVVQSLTNSFGEMVIACNVIVMRVDGFAMMPNMTFGQAMTTFTGQNVGANKPHRIAKGTKQGLILAVGTATILVTLILIFGKYLVNVFTQTQELVDFAVRMLRLLSVGYIAMAVTQSLSGVMRGVGDTMTPMWISMCTTILARVPLAYSIAYFTRSAEYPNGRPEAVFISLLGSWTLGAIISSIVFRAGRWKRKLPAGVDAAALTEEAGAELEDADSTSAVGEMQTVGGETQVAETLAEQAEADVAKAQTEGSEAANAEIVPVESTTQETEKPE